MKITMIKCDRCGRIIDEGKQYKLVAPDGSERDLCEKCSTEIFVSFPIEEKPKNKRQKRVDHGKIHALHEAGWKMRDIAMDVGCSEQTVYTSLKNEMWKEGATNEVR